MGEKWLERMLALKPGDPQFEEMANEAWAYQYAQNPVLRQYADDIDAKGPVSLPIGAFKYQSVKTGDFEPLVRFESSRTTGQSPSVHEVADPGLYEAVSLAGFRLAYGPGKFRVLALLPSYLERGTSSLVYMVRTWMNDFGTTGSGFFLDDLQALAASAREAAQSGERILLIGVAFALLDLADMASISFPENTLVFETGGMKGRRAELTRSQLHAHLRQGLGVSVIHSEYGMTELLSQAYTGEHGRFVCPPWMRIRVSDIHLDELTPPPGTTGRLHVTDLANIHSCCFLATDDLARLYPDGSFEVMGRLDTAEMRGCNLMYIG